MKKNILLAILLASTFIACSTKRQYFEPEQEVSKIQYSGSLSSDIIASSNAGATLKNGSIVTDDGIKNGYDLQSGYKMLNINDNKAIISADIEGNLKIKNAAGITIYQRKFDEAVVSAAMQDDLLAAVSADNQIFLIDTINNGVMLQYASKQIYAIDSRAASPYFLGSIVIYPSLDGKIYVVNKKTGQIIKDETISSDDFFNNVIYHGVSGDTMIAATAKRIVSINPDKSIYLDGEIKNVLVSGDNIYIFKKDGTILRTDLDLIELNKTYFKFAIFAGATIVDDELYIIEKTGYLFKTKLNLSQEKIYALPTSIDDKFYLSDRVLYFDSNYINLK